MCGDSPSKSDEGSAVGLCVGAERKGQHVDKHAQVLPAKEPQRHLGRRTGRGAAAMVAARRPAPSAQVVVSWPREKRGGKTRVVRPERTFRLPLRHHATPPRQPKPGLPDTQYKKVNQCWLAGGQGRRQASISSTASCIAASAPTCSDVTGAERLALLNHNTRGYMTA